MNWLIDRKARRATISTWAAVAACAVSICAAQAEPDYPTKPVEMITPAAAGNGPDVAARIVADQLSRMWKQQVVVLNKPGASGLIAANAAHAMPPDGYNLYASNTSSMVVLPVTGKLTFDIFKAFVPIGIYAQQIMTIAVSPTLGVNSLAELIALAKKKPGEIFYSATTRESLPNYTMQMMLMGAGVSMSYVFYSSTSQALGDIAGGRLSVLCDGYAAMAGAIAGGVVKPLAVTSSERLPNHPELPTVGETLKDFHVEFLVPADGARGHPERDRAEDQQGHAHAGQRQGASGSVRKDRNVHARDDARGARRLHRLGARQVAAGDREGRAHAEMISPTAPSSARTNG